MKFIKQLGIILSFAFAGEVIARLLPGILPASVIGLILMLIALGFKLLKHEHIKESAVYLSSIMALFFIPAVASILLNTSLILPVLWQLVVIGLISTFVTFFVTYGTVRLLRILLNRLTVSSGNKARNK